MSPANRHPKAIVFHVALIVGLLLMHYWLAPPLLLTALLLLAAALWPWFTVWRAADDGATAADTPPAFSELTKNLSRNTCHNALSAAQVAFSAEQLASRLQSQLKAVSEIANGAEAIAATEQDSAERARHTLDAAQSVRQRSDAGQAELQRAIERMQQLSAQTHASRELIDGLSARTEEIRRITDVIQSIASQTNLLALNAAIEAARAGELDAAAEQIATTGEQLSGIAGLAGSVESQVEQITTGTADNHQRLTGQFVALDQLRADALDSEKQTRQLEQAAERLVAQAESASEQLAEVQLDDYHQAMFDLARQGAAAIAERFEADIQAGRVSLDDLFDRNYRALPNTDPVKYQTRFDKYADEVLPAIQEPLLQRHPALVYAIATTPEGYVPTHNRAFSQPPVGNPEIDRVKSRSKRLFNDRTGGRCGSHQRRLLLQTYSRDTGELMHDLSVPIMVRGRHWGGLRLGYRPEQ
ncbi:methyl-accepting chemotaxis protein [Stutzerimonas sp. Brlt_13]|uniref:methyl-accepting chemotaxis protein n=1 Tax=unclassified Stutzerimonas TaxID=2901165 RepID=UPI003F81A680